MDDKKKLLLIGGGGHCRSILDSVLSSNQYHQIGIIDYNQSASAFEIPVVGTDDDLPRFRSEGWNYAFVSLGSIGSTSSRRRLYQAVKEIGFRVPAIIDPTAIIANGTEIGEGTYIGKRVVVNTGSRIGICAILNTGSIIEHDCTVGEFSHISPGAILCGQTSIGNDTHVGAGSVVRQGINIGYAVLIGAGSVVVKDVPDGNKAFGNPCRVVV